MNLVNAWDGLMRISSAVLLLIGATLPAAAQQNAVPEPVQVCVLCAQPDRTYACEVLPPEDGRMAQSPQLFCAAEVAKANGHASCAVRRNNPTACVGTPITLAYTGPIAEPEVGADVEAVAQPIEQQGPPKTLVEATDRAVVSTGEQIKKAGEAIGDTGKTVSDVTKKTGKTIVDTGSSIGKTVTDAAKSGWDCVISLFQTC